MKIFDQLPPMDHLRSEKMSFVQLIMPVESSHRAITYLGDLGLLQFKDVSDLTTLRSTHEICIGCLYYCVNLYEIPGQSLIPSSLTYLFCGNSMLNF